MHLISFAIRKTARKAAHKPGSVPARIEEHKRRFKTAKDKASRRAQLLSNTTSTVLGKLQHAPKKLGGVAGRIAEHKRRFKALKKDAGLTAPPQSSEELTLDFSWAGPHTAHHPSSAGATAAVEEDYGLAPMCTDLQYLKPYFPSQRMKLPLKLEGNLIQYRKIDRELRRKF